MDVAFRQRLEPLFDMLFQKYWRVEIEGLEHVPADGAGVLVANHAGLLPFDALMVMHALEHYHPTGRTVRFLIEDWFYHFPVISVLINRLGMVRASSDNAHRLLREQQLIGVFPEGDKGISKPYTQRYRLQRFGRGGTVRLCMQTGAPAIPMAIVGSEEAYPLLGRSKLAARLTGLPLFPLTPLFPWLGPLGFVPMPSKWVIRFEEPIHFDQFSEEDAKDDLLVGEINEQIRVRVQNAVRELIAGRRRTFI